MKEIGNNNLVLSIEEQDILDLGHDLSVLQSEDIIPISLASQKLLHYFGVVLQKKKEEENEKIN